MECYGIFAVFEIVESLNNMIWVQEIECEHTYCYLMEYETEDDYESDSLRIPCFYNRQYLLISID